MIAAEQDLSQQLGEIAAKRRAAYRDMILGLARGEQFASDAVDQIATAAGRTLEQLKADVDRTRQRYEAHLENQEADKMQPDIDALRAELQHAEGELAAARQHADAIVAKAQGPVDKLRFRLNGELSNQSAMRSSARDAMRSTITEETQGELRRLREVYHKRLGSLQNELRQVQQTAANHQSMVEAAGRSRELLESYKRGDLVQPRGMNQAALEQRVLEEEERANDRPNFEAQVAAIEGQLASTKQAMDDLEVTLEAWDGPALGL